MAYRFDEGWLSSGANGAQHLNAALVWLPKPPVLKAKPGMPWPELTTQTAVPGGVWQGTTRGAFFEREGASSRYATPWAPGIDPPRFRYYAGKRWLRDDYVVDLAWNFIAAACGVTDFDAAGSVWTLRGAP